MTMVKTRITNFSIALSRADKLECELIRISKNNFTLRHLFLVRQLSLSLILSSDLTVAEQREGQKSKVGRILQNLKYDLRRRKRSNDLSISSRLMKIPEPARAVLLSDIAYTLRGDIDDYTQIDFGNDKHMKLLKAAIDSSISKVVGKQGRPVNEPMDKLFIGLRDLYEASTGKKATAEARYSNKPKTDFEKLIYLGYQIIRPAQKYQAAHKAYERAISRIS